MVDSVEMNAGETPAYTQEQIDAANGVESTPEVSTERPEGLPENFKSVEDLAKSYKELQTKLSQGKSEQPKETEGESAEAEEQPKETLDKLKIAEEADAKGEIDIHAMSDEFAANGELGDANYEKLEALGIDRDTVDNFIQYQINQFQAPLLNEAGGQENYNDMVNWAANNISEGEQDAYNRAISSDPQTAMLAVQGLKAKYEAANGTPDPSYVDGKQNISVTGFESWAQVTEAMSNPKYNSDPAYRANVERMLAASNL